MKRLCKAADVAPQSVRRVATADGKIFAVYNLDGVFHATSDRCTHGNASLAQGEIEDGSIICPLHLGAFDIATGEPTAPPCEIPLETFPVRLEDGEVWLDESGN